MRPARSFYYLAPLPAAIALGLFFAAAGDLFHHFAGKAGEWHAVVSSSFSHDLPWGLALGVLVVAATWIGGAFYASFRGGHSLTRALELTAPCFLPLAVGLLLPLRYVPGLAGTSGFLSLLVGPLMGPLLLVALILTLLLIVRATTGQEAALLKRTSLLPRLTDRTIGWLIFAALVLFYIIATPFFSASFAFGGDQPHYLIVTHSLVDDGDIYIADDHEDGAWREFTPIHIEPQFFVRTTDGRIIPFHRIGMPILAMLPYLLLGKLGALYLIGLMAAFAAANSYWLAMKLVRHRPAALLATAWSALSVPVLPLSFMFFSEVPALLVTLVALNLIIRWREEDPPSLPWLLPALIWTLPWMHARDMITAIALSAFLVWKTRQRPVLAVALALLCIIFSAGIPLYNLAFYGTLSPVAEMGSDQGFAFQPMNVINGLGGLLFDQEFGILLYNPALLLALLGLLPLFRRRPSEAIWLFIIAGFSIGPNILYRMWWGGGSPPGRYYVAVFHLAAIPLAALLSSQYFRRLRPVFYGLAIGAIAFAALLLMNNDLLVNDRDGTASALTAVSLGTVDAVEWWPSWIAGGFARSWALAALLVIWMSATTGLIMVSRRFIMPVLQESHSYGHGLFALAGLLLFMISAGLYAPIAEGLTPDEPNEGQPFSHELDQRYHERYRNEIHAFTDIQNSDPANAFPARRFSAYLLFPRTELTPDEESPRGRSYPIGSEGTTINLLRDEPFWAGSYEISVLLRSQEEPQEIALRIEDLGHSENSAEKRQRLGIAFEEITMNIELPNNSPGLAVRISPTSGAVRFLHVLVKPVNLSRKSNWNGPADAFVLPVWRLPEITLYANPGTIYPPEGSQFWTAADSRTSMYIAADSAFSSVTFDVTGRYGTAISFSAEGGQIHRVNFDDTRRNKAVIPVSPTQTGDGRWWTRIEMDVRGGFVPAEVDSGSSDRRRLGVRMAIEVSSDSGR